MTKIVLPFLYKTSAKGRTYYYYRRNKLRIPLPMDPATQEFGDAYHRAHASFETGATPAAAPGSIAALVEAFRKSSDYGALRPRVRQLYAPALDRIKDKLGGFPAKALTRRVALEWRDELATRKQKMADGSIIETPTPARANNVLSVLKRLYSFGLDRGIVKQNPLLGLKRLKTGEWRPWTLTEVADFRAKTQPHMRLVLDLALYTGQRLGDVVAMRWNHIEDGGILVTQQKTGERVWIPIHKNLRAAIDDARDAKKRDDAQRTKDGKAARPDAVTILTAARGLPYTAENLKHKFKDAVRAAGLADDLVFHGLRKTAAVAMAEAGCSTAQIKAITGHRTDDMAAYYSRQANQKILAKAAVRKLEKKK